MEKSKSILAPSPSGEDYILEPDENNNLVLSEIPDPDFKMHYSEYNEKAIKKIEVGIRGAFEYKELFHFIKSNLNVDHCSYYSGYSMKLGLTIELHHAPFTLYDITEAVVCKFLKEQGFYENFRVIEQVNRLHYEFKVGLTPLNPTAHKLVHTGALPVHPKIIIGNWKELYSEYAAYWSDVAIKKYNDCCALETTDDIRIPKILEYRPMSIKSPVQALTSEIVDKLCIDAKFKLLEKM